MISEADEEDEVFNDEDTEISSKELRISKKGRVRPDNHGLYRSPESLRSIFADTKTSFSKVMDNFRTSGQIMLDTFLNYITGVPEQRRTN